MGTSLTGLTPATTYDALIKVGDNGPLSGTLKTLSDGLGNDSALSLATGSASITGTLEVSGNVTLDTTTLVVDASGDRVIMGASGALQGDTLEIHAKSNSGAISVFGRASDNGSAISFRSNGATTQKAQIYGSDAGLGFATGTTQRMLIDTTGNVGIGTTTPSADLQVRKLGNGNAVIISNDQTGSQVNIGVGVVTGGRPFVGTNTDTNPLEIGTRASSDMIFLRNSTEIARITANGLTFNGDTAAANALDDYEEGTFTATLTPSTSGTIVLSPSTCSYTKIGRQVTVRGQIVVSAVSSPVGSIVILGGLPFTSQNSVSSRGAGVFQYFPAVGSGSLLLNYQLQNSVEVNLILDASTIGAGAEFYVSLTYFV